LCSEARFDGFKKKELATISSAFLSNSLLPPSTTLPHPPPPFPLTTDVSATGSSFGVPSLNDGKDAYTSDNSSDSDSDSDSNNPNIKNRRSRKVRRGEARRTTRLCNIMSNTLWFTSFHSAQAPQLTLSESIAIFAEDDVDNPTALPVSVEKGSELFSLDLANMTQCVQPGNSRNDLEIQFGENDALSTLAGLGDDLCQIRFYVASGEATDKPPEGVSTEAEKLRSRILKVVEASGATNSDGAGHVIARFEEAVGNFVTPRGKYSLELSPTHLRLRGAKYDYKIPYAQISRFYLLPRLDEVR